MTRVLFASWPFEGHLLPQIGIALALRERGAEVAFYTAEKARSMLEREQLPIFPFRRVGEPWAPIHALEARTGGRRQSPRVQRAAFRSAVDTIPAQVEDLREAISAWRPDVLVTEIALWAPFVVLWEADGVPVAMSSWALGAQIPGPDTPPLGLGLAAPRTRAQRACKWGIERVTDVLATPMRRRVDALRAHYGLAPMGCSINAFTGRLPLYLVGNVRALDHDRGDLPPNVHYVGPCLWHPPADRDSAEWLDRVPTGRAWVHVTEGTTHYKDPFLLRAASAGLMDGPWEVVLTTGRARDVDLLRAGNVHVRGWLSHTELLPRCRVVVTTGGAGTIIAAMRAGVPLVVVPTTWDKPDNASRVVAAGVGIRLAASRCSPERLREAVQTVLRDPRYALAARRMQQRFTDAPGAPRAAELIELLAARGTRRERAGAAGGTA